jgi:Sulfotransferase family
MALRYLDVLISHTRKFVFIHIYRTGGTSVTSALVRYARLRDQLADRFYLSRGSINVVNGIFDLFDNGNRWIKGIHKHATALQARRYLGDEAGRYFVFAFVRNPWDWQVSIYEYIKRTREHKKHRLAKTLSFPEFLEREIAANAVRQVDFLKDDRGEVIVDAIGRFESLQQSLDAIALRIGIPRMKVEHLNSSGMDSDYRTYYDSASIKLVENYFRQDVEYFGYAF